MSLKKFIKDKIVLTILILVGIITIEIFLIPYPFGTFIKLYIPISILIVYIIGILIEYITKNKFYKNLLDLLYSLDEKYLIAEIMNTPNFIEGSILREVLEQTDKAMIENVNKYKYMRRRL